MIGIYYIATGPYTQYFYGFLEYLDIWFPDEEKVISLIASDELQMYDGLEENGIRIEYHHIQHLPWPAISLYKFYLISQNKIHGARLHFYFNANTIFTKHCKEFDFSIFKDDVITLSQHAHGDINNSYAQAGAICIPNILFDTFCDKHEKITNSYLQKSFIVPKFHDETVLNKITLKLQLLPYKFFPDNLRVRWLSYDGSTNPKDGLCYLINKDFQQRFKGK